MRFFFQFYRTVLSPLLGPRCRFYPSCSHYAEDALQRHGLWTGGLMAIRRILRCQPFHPGGVDPVPGSKEMQPWMTKDARS